MLARVKVWMELERIKTKEVLQGFSVLKVMLSDINITVQCPNIYLL